MDVELIFWILVFVGGYSAILAWLLMRMLRSGGGSPHGGGGPPGDGGHGGGGSGGAGGP